VRPVSRVLLKELGLQLAPWAGDIKIRVIGFTDETEKKQSELAYMRAARVIETLTDSSGLPEKIFLIGPSETIQAPYPGNTLENRLKNRTVILIITAGDEE
jgi:flagellar motor protein MotB